MPDYRVKVLNRNKQIEELDVQYPSFEALQVDFHNKGEWIISYKEKSDRENRLISILSRIRTFFTTKSLKDEEVYGLFYELGIMLKAGVPIIKAIKMVADESRHRSVRRLLDDLNDQIKEGGVFSDILRNSSLYNFKPVVPILQMGEKTGRMWDSFLRISKGIERWLKIKAEITNALMYPLLLVGTSLVAVYVVLVYVIPKFRDIVSSFEVSLPFNTAVLFEVSLFMSRNQDLIIVAFILLLVGILLLFRYPKTRSMLSAITYRIPFVKRFRFSLETLRFLNALSSLLTGGVPILLAFKMALENFSSNSIKTKLALVSSSLKKGDSLGKSIKRLNIFPDIIPNMIIVGEESGNLPEVLNELYEYFSERYLRKTKRLMNLLEPLIIMFIAVFIGFIVISIIPIIISLSDINF